MGYKIITLFSGLITFWLGVYVYRHNKNNSVNQRFYYFMLALSGWILINFAVAMKPSAYLIQQTYSFGTLAAAFGFLWILWLIGRPLPKGILRWANILCVVVLSVGAVPGVIVSQLISYQFTRQDVEFGPVFMPLSIFNIVLIIGIITLLIRQYAISKGIKRTRIKYILIGLGTSCTIPMVGAYALPLFGIHDYTNYDAPSMIIFVVLASYSMSHYQLMSVQLFGKKIMTTFGIIMLGAACLFVVSYLFHHVFGPVFGVMFGILVLAVATSFIPSVDLRKFLNLTIMKDKYDYALMVSDFVAVVSNVLNTKELGGYAIEFLSKAVGIPNACIFLYKKNKFGCIAARKFIEAEITDHKALSELL